MQCTYCARIALIKYLAEPGFWECIFCLHHRTNPPKSTKEILLSHLIHRCIEEYHHSPKSLECNVNVLGHLCRYLLNHIEIRSLRNIE